MGLIFWKENIKTNMGLKLVPVVSTCFVEKFGTPNQNLGFQWNEIINNWLKTNIQMI
jgi:hypothetical protein